MGRLVSENACFEVFWASHDCFRSKQSPMQWYNGHMLWALDTRCELRTKSHEISPKTLPMKSLPFHVVLMMVVTLFWRDKWKEGVLPLGVMSPPPHSSEGNLFLLTHPQRYHPALSMVPGRSEETLSGSLHSSVLPPHGRATTL